MRWVRVALSSEHGVSVKTALKVRLGGCYGSCSGGAGDVRTRPGVWLSLWMMMHTRSKDVSKTDPMRVSVGCTVLMVLMEYSQSVHYWSTPHVLGFHRFFIDITSNDGELPSKLNWTKACIQAKKRPNAVFKTLKICNLSKIKNNILELPQLFWLPSQYSSNSSKFIDRTLPSKSFFTQFISLKCHCIHAGDYSLSYKCSVYLLCRVVFYRV